MNRLTDEARHIQTLLDGPASVRLLANSMIVTGGLAAILSNGQFPALLIGSIAGLAGVFTRCVEEPLADFFFSRRNQQDEAELITSHQTELTHGTTY